MSDLTVTAVTESLQLALKDTERQRNEARESLALADAEVEERRTQVGQLKAELTTANARIAELEADLGTAINGHRLTADKLTAANARADAAEATAFERNMQLTRAESETAALRAELTELNGELTRMQKTRNDAIVMAERFRAKHEECNDCELIAALRAELDKEYQARGQDIRTLNTEVEKWKGLAHEECQRRSMVEVSRDNLRTEVERQGKMLDVCSAVHGHNVKLKSERDALRAEVERLRAQRTYVSQGGHWCARAEAAESEATARRAEVERLRAAKLDREERFVAKHAELVAAESSLAEARALLDRCTMVPHSLLDDIRKWQSANPESPRAAADPLHPTGRCACGGEGTCEWCMRHCLHCGAGTPRAAAERACPWCNRMCCFSLVCKAELARRAVKP